MCMCRRLERGCDLLSAVKLLEFHSGAGDTLASLHVL